MKFVTKTDIIIVVLWTVLYGLPLHQKGNVSKAIRHHGLPLSAFN